jgi:hypothetical protein
VAAQVSVSRIDVGVVVEEGRYKRDAATGVRGEWGAVVVGRAGFRDAAPLRVWAYAHGCRGAVRFKSPFARGGTPATAGKASGYLFNIHRHAETGKWYAQIWLRGVPVNTRLHKHAWQAAAELEWQLARWCAHTGDLRSHYVSNAARLVELGHADAAGVLTEAVTVSPWDLSPWEIPSAPAAAPVAPAPRRVSARAAARRGARATAPAPAVGVGGPAEAPQPHILVELEHLTRKEQRLVAPWLTDDLLDAMACRRDDEPPSPEVAAYVAILRAERALREAEQAVATAAAAAAGGGAGHVASAEEAAADVAVVADAAHGAGVGGGGWGGAIGLAIADAAAAEPSGGVWQDAWEGVWDGPAVVVPPDPAPAPAAAAAAAAVGSKRRRGSGAESSEAAAARAGAGGRRRVEEGAVGGMGGS